MVRRHARRHASISPIHPSLHFVLFLILALLLIVVVTAVMRQTAVDTRARLLCPQRPVNLRELIPNLVKQCPAGVEYATDLNGCGTWVCKAPVATGRPLPMGKTRTR